MSSAASRPSSTDALRSPRDYSSYWLLLALLAMVVVVYWPTWQSMVRVWNTPTYSHAYLIPVVSLWLAYEKRTEISKLTPTVWWLMVPVVLALGLIWLVGDLAGVNTIAHFSVVSTIAVIVAFVLGKHFAYALRFPLAFLLLAVPFGDFLVPYMMDWTANVTIWMVQVSGVPIYREGLAFILPSGAWEVVEECSGQRYLIALLPLALLFSHLSFTYTRTKILFVVSSLAIAVIANWIRAYLIVMTGHISDMALATGVDHLIYGWFFFGIIAALLFVWGSRWKESNVPNDVSLVQANTPGSTANEPLAKRQYPFFRAALAGTFALIAGSAAAHLLSHQQAMPAALSAQLAPIIANEAIENSLGLEIPFAGAHETLQGRVGDGANANIWISTYLNGDASSEMIRSRHSIVASNRSKLRHNKTQVIDLPNQNSATEFSFIGRQQDVLVWQMYFVNGQIVGNEGEAKVQLALQRLRGAGANTAVAIVWTAYQSDPAIAQERLSSVANTLAQKLKPDGHSQ
ncbi:MAG: exosortase A [Burkholderiaceae bacterium]